MINLNYTNEDVVKGFDEHKEDSIKIELQPVGFETGTIIIYLKGYLDTYNSMYFRDQITKAVDAGFYKIIFCCEELMYISSTGVATFTTILREVKQHDGDIFLVSVQPRVFDVLQLLGFIFLNVDKIPDNYWKPYRP